MKRKWNGGMWLRSLPKNERRRRKKANGLVHKNPPSDNAKKKRKIIKLYLKKISFGCKKVKTG
jgi:hypothetical protein